MTKNIAFQGVFGAYSHLACQELYPDAQYLPCASFNEAFAAVQNGSADFAVILIENSNAGRVADVHFLLSQTPLHIASYFGVTCTGISLVAIIFIIMRKLIFGDPVQGWASNICVIFFLGGIQLFCIGMMGEYIAKTYTEVKKRPHYIVRESSDDEIKKIG